MHFSWPEDSTNGSFRAFGPPKLISAKKVKREQVFATNWQPIIGAIISALQLWSSQIWWIPIEFGKLPISHLQIDKLPNWCIRATRPNKLFISDWSKSTESEDPLGRVEVNQMIGEKVWPFGSTFLWTSGGKMCFGFSGEWSKIDEGVLVD